MLLLLSRHDVVGGRISLELFKHEGAFKNNVLAEIQFFKDHHTVIVLYGIFTLY